MIYSVKQLNNIDEKQVRYRLIQKMLLCFCISFIFTGLCINDSCFCMAIAFIGASGADIFGLFALIGGCLGYSFFFGFDEAAIYIASSVMVYTVSFVFQ